jgi:polyphosphate glucokinase
MADAPSSAKKILVVDVGGTHIKFASTDHPGKCEFDSGPAMTAAEMVEQLLKLTRKWRYDVVSIGYPGVVSAGRPVCEPANLGTGWVEFAFEEAFGKPVKILNDAAMQALGNYQQRGTMLFLGLGTGLGSALIADGVVVPMELGHLQRNKGRHYESYLGNHGRKRLGNKKWRAEVHQVVEDFRKAFLPDEIVLGGGNARRLNELPPHTRLGDTLAAFHGGMRIWGSSPIATKRKSKPSSQSD